MFNCKSSLIKKTTSPLLLTNVLAILTNVRGGGGGSKLAVSIIKQPE
jgi:hypothetical protein